MPLTQIDLFNHPIYQDYACDPITGDIYSLKYNKIKLMSQTLKDNGYLSFIICHEKLKKRYHSHRFIWECYENEIIGKDFEIDHRDHIKTNNSINNLRKVSRMTNILNRFENKEVDELPDDAEKITRYGKHQFENIWFSPTTNFIYRYSDDYLFEIHFKYKNSVIIRDINNNKVQICLNKLRKILGYI